MNRFSTIKVKLILMFLLTFSNLYAATASINPSITGTASNIAAKHIGPAIGGAMFAIAIDPTNKSNIFASGDAGVVYHTVNEGMSWNIVPGMSRIYSIKFDPNNTNTIWAVGGTGIYKSIDGGATWQYSFESYHRYNFSLGTIAIDPTDSNIVYVAEGFVPSLRLTHLRGRVFKTTNGGVTWTNLSRPGGNAGTDTIYSRNYSKIIIDPNSSYTQGVGHSDVYVMGRDGLFKTTDAGGSWTNITFFDEGQGSDAILIDDNNQSTLVVSVIPMQGHLKEGVYKSIDNGLTWQAINTGLTPILSQLSTINTSITKINQFSLMLANSASDKNKIYVGSWRGIAITTNQGQSWTQTTPAETPYAQHVSGAYVQVPLNTHPNQTKTFVGGIDHFRNMTVSDTDSNFTIFGDNQDLHFSSDGGTVWESRTFDYNTSFVNAPDMFPTFVGGEPANRYTHKIESRGVQGLVNTDIAIDPFNPQIYYATYMDVGLQVSRDGGQTWEHPSDGLPPKGHAWSVTVDPNNNGIVWVSIGESGEIFGSMDHGVSWINVSLNSPSTGKVTDMTFDAQNNILYAASEIGGVFKSTDNGLTWQNLFAVGTFDIKIDPSNQSILYAGTKTGLYQSIDGGSSWNQLASAQMGKVYNISVGNNNTIYVISNIAGVSVSWENRKLWVSVDSGASFSDITPSFMHRIGGVAVTPNNSQHLYISTYATSQRYTTDEVIMAQSNDGGVTWENLMDNFAFALGTDIYINPNNSNNIFFNTNFSLIEINNTAVTPLIANAGADMNVTLAESNPILTLDGSASTPATNGTIVQYEWFYNGSSLGTGEILAVQVPSSGIYPVTLTVTDDLNNTASDTVNVEVLLATPLQANAGPDMNVTLSSSSQTVTLDGSASVPATNGSIVQYEWVYNGTSIGTGMTLNVTPPASGTYPITLTVTDDLNNTASDIVNVEVLLSFLP